jgi:hypothetical protein
MSNSTHPDDASTHPTDASTQCDEQVGSRLRSVVVTYEGTADRQTLYPPAATEVQRLTHWLTADADAFHRLDEMR